ncbi:MAG: hypothetical protein U0797_04975 [Gemmataceae bacterium]
MALGDGRLGGDGDIAAGPLQAHLQPAGDPPGPQRHQRPASCLKLFKESARVALRAQGRILVGAGRLMLLAVVPMLVMAVPVCLLLGQLSLWYQARPLRVGEEAVVTLKLNGAEPRTEVALKVTDAAEVTLGPVRVPSKGEVCWQVRAREAGQHRLVFLVEGQEVEKDLAVGDGFMRVSALRPGWSWSDALLHPWEPPFRPGSPVQSVEIDYPRRESWTSGTDSWLVYWFAVSLVAGFCLRRWLNVDV